MFHYSTGELVMVGDVVQSFDKTGEVVEIIEPCSDRSKELNLKDGGVMVVEHWVSANNQVLYTPPDGTSWEDLLLVRRNKVMSG